MEPHQCLFSCENNSCNDIAREEHIIQEGLAGTLSSPYIICDNCNSFFSQLDINLTHFYRPILEILSPLLPGKLKARKSEAKLLSEEIPLEITPGGVAGVAKIACKYDANGQLQEMWAPESVPQEKLEMIAKKKGATTTSFERKLLSKYWPDLKRLLSFEVSLDLTRAILLDILELAHYGHVKPNLCFPNIAKHDCLKKLRLLIRKGFPFNQLPPKEIIFAFAPISDLLDRLFKPSIFSHRLVVSYDHHSKTLIFVAQFVNTMPWIFILENLVLQSSPVSILYKKAMINGSDECFTKNCSVLDIPTIRWRKFSTATRHAREFAKTKMMQEYGTQYSRAYYELDLRSDEEIYRKLSNYTNDYRNKTKIPEIDAIVKTMESRYLGTLCLNDILEITRNKALEMWTNTFFSSGQQNQKILYIYRECLKYIKNEFGYSTLFEKDS